MKIIGITGKSGSGKTELATLLAGELQGKYIDIDKIGHEANKQPEILKNLCETFGKVILDTNGQLDRKKLGSIVFLDKNKMDQLTDITWGYMQKQLDSIMAQSNDIFVLDWILLPKSKYWEMCDLRILVTADDEIRKIKILERDNITEEYFEKRDSASLDYSPFKFDYIFENDYQNETIEKIVETIKKGMK